MLSLDTLVRIAASRHLYILFTACLLCIASSGNALAQETSRRAFVNQAKEALKSFDSNAAYTTSRCSLDGNSVSSNAIVSQRANQFSVLELGDRIIGISGRRLSPVSATAMIERLRSISADASVEVEMIRGGETLLIEVPCQDSLLMYGGARSALQAAAASDFAGCVEQINRMETHFRASPDDDWLRFNCAYHAGMLKHPAAHVMGYYEYLRRLIEYSRWDDEDLGSVRATVLANRAFFADRQQLPLYQELQAQLDSAAGNGGSSVGRSSPPVNARRRSITSGTGFFVSSDGIIITSAHVVADGRTILVSTSSGMKLNAQVVALSEATDLAILKVDYRPARFLSLAPPRSAQVGTPVFTYGWPVSHLLGKEPKFTDGSISSLSGLGGEQSYLQISVPVQPGNSGGPLVNDSGYVVGIIASQAAIAPFLKQTGTLPQSINWAVKAEYAALLADLPSRQSASTSRADAIAVVRDSICYIEVDQ